MSRKNDALAARISCPPAMDEIVRRAIAKWPNVPSVYNWLSLDRRGNWLVKGERIANAAVVDFIGRNYEHDDQRRWYFQNGPQRVFVKLGYTPFIYRLESAPPGRPELRTHTDRSAHTPSAAWMDEKGDVLVETEIGVGLIVDRDLPLVLERLMTRAGEAVDDAMLELMLGPSAPSEIDVQLHVGGRTVDLQRIRSTDVPARFDFDPDPQPAAGEPDC
jgi:hypothetical protein